mmetsp:Transcript_13683/g.42577  ORF Transcript_13683/g.42577 Transcript_13683/m.42577 type:complete len:562 (-) Transcript_13683:727-2412(-)
MLRTSNMRLPRRRCKGENWRHSERCSVGRVPRSVLQRGALLDAQRRQVEVVEGQERRDFLRHVKRQHADADGRLQDSDLRRFVVLRNHLRRFARLLRRVRRAERLAHLAHDEGERDETEHERQQQHDDRQRRAAAREARELQHVLVRDPVAPRMDEWKSEVEQHGIHVHAHALEGDDAADPHDRHECAVLAASVGPPAAEFVPHTAWEKLQLTEELRPRPLRLRGRRRQVRVHVLRPAERPQLEPSFVDQAVQRLLHEVEVHIARRARLVAPPRAPRLRNVPLLFGVRLPVTSHRLVALLRRGGGHTVVKHVLEPLERLRAPLGQAAPVEAEAARIEWHGVRPGQQGEQREEEERQLRRLERQRGGEEAHDEPPGDDETGKVVGPAAPKHVLVDDDEHAQSSQQNHRCHDQVEVFPQPRRGKVRHPQRHPLESWEATRLRVRDAEHGRHQQAQRRFHDFFPRENGGEDVEQAEDIEGDERRLEGHRAQVVRDAHDVRLRDDREERQAHRQQLQPRRLPERRDGDELDHGLRRGFDDGLDVEAGVGLHVPLEALVHAADEET